MSVIDVTPVRSPFQRQQVCGVALERAAKHLPICFAHIPSDDRGRCDLDCHHHPTMRTLDQLGGPRVRRRSDIWHEPAHSISVTIRPSRSVQCLRCLCRMMQRGRGSRSLTRFWACTADFEPCGCAWTWLYKYAHHQTSTTPQPCGWSHLGSSLRATRCNGFPTSVEPENPKEKP
jgi:hypothetical protein